MILNYFRCFDHMLPECSLQIHFLPEGSVLVSEVGDGCRTLLLITGEK